MKKRIVAILLSVVLLFSSMPVVMATDGSNLGYSEDNPIIISSFDDFKSFLDNSDNSSQVMYYSLEADITAPDGVVVGGGDVSNVIFEGNHHTISNLKINEALFGTVSNSSIRDINFVSAEVTASGASKDVLMAVVAKETEDLLAYITGCTFDKCEIVLPPDADSVSAAMVVANNYGTVTNCVVNSNCSFINENDSAVCNLGGITANNISNYEEESVIANCISGIDFSNTQASAESLFGGIAAVNDCLIENSYSYATADDVNFGIVCADGTGYTNNCVYRIGSTYYSDATNNPYDKSLYILAANMSKNASAYNDLGLNYQPAIAEGDYAAMWTVEDNNLFLSFDGKTAVVTMHIDNAFYNTAVFSSVSFEPTISTGFEEISKNSNGSVSAYAVMTGAYSDGEYIRNSLKVTLRHTNDFVASNDLVLSPVNSSSKQSDNVFTGDGTKYSDVFCSVKMDNKDSVFKVEMYPFASNLKVDTDSSQNTVSAYNFMGEGTADSPFEISSEYELRCLSNHISNTLTYLDKDGVKREFSKAYYKLTNDITMDSENGVFTPIGINSETGKTYFQGSFDGQSHTIYNLRISTTTNIQGLFGATQGIKEGKTYTRKAVIKNLNVLNATIEEADTTSPADIKGILVGRAEGTVISGCVTSGTVSGGTQLGGLVGYSYYSDILNCGTSADIHSYSSKAWVGGLAGYLQHSEVKNCYAAGVALNNVIIEEKYLQTGGITGYIVDTAVDRAYYLDCNKTMWDSNVRGISSADSNTLKSDEFLSDIINYSVNSGLNNYWSKDTSKNQANKGYPINAPADNAYYSVNCISTSNGVVTADKSTAKKGEQITVTSTYDGWSKLIITDVQRNKLDELFVKEGETKISFSMYGCSIRIVPVFDDECFEGRGNSDDPYVIYTYEDLVRAAQLMNDDANEYRPELGVPYMYYERANYVLANDIDCKGQSIIPLGAYEGFRGTFDGQGHTISNLKIVGDDVVYYSERGAFFAKTNGATVKNLVLDNIEVSGANAAILSGISFKEDNRDSVFENIVVSNCKVSGKDQAALAFATVSSAMLRNCIFDNCSVESDDRIALVAADYITTYNVDMYNTVFADVSGVETGCFYDDTDIDANVANNYYDSSLAVDEAAEMQATAVSESEFSDKKFISKLSYYAEQNGLNLWGQKDTGRLTISMNGKPAPVSQLTYDSIFEDKSYLPTIITSSVKPAYTAGELVEIKYDPRASVANIRVMCAGKQIAYAVNPQTDSNGYGTLCFVMPEGAVHIDNNGEKPALVSIKGKGTAQIPYLIHDKYELLFVASVINGEAYYALEDDEIDFRSACFMLANDIDLTGVKWNSIGTSSYSFYGTFDGDGKAITGLSDAPLFNKLMSTATVTNVVFENPNFVSQTPNADVVAVVASENGGTISKCIIRGGELYAYSTNLGGFVGKNNGLIEKCAVIDTYIHKYQYNFVINYAIFAYSNSGEIRDSFVYNCRFNENRFNPYFVQDMDGYYTNCYFYILSDAGTPSSMTSKEKFNSGEVAYLLNNRKTDGTQAWYQNIDNGLPAEDYPVFENKGNNTVYYLGYTNLDYSNYAEPQLFDKDENNNFIIRTYDDLCNMRSLVNEGNQTYVSGSFVLGNDITCPDGSYWYPAIGSEKAKFTGTFDGKGYAIDGLTFDAHNNNATYTGLFGYIGEGAVVKDVNLTNVYADVLHIGSDGYFGVVCAYAYGATISGCSVQGNLNLENLEYAGGICGRGVSTIERCTAFGTLVYDANKYEVNKSDSYVAGICGYGYNTINCANHMDITMTQNRVSDSLCRYYVGGIDTWGATVKNCYSYGEVSAKATLAYPTSSKAENCYFKDNKSSEYGKTAEQFASGEVAYLLNSGVTDGTQVWYQNIDNGKPANDYPVFDGGTVYKNLKCNGEVDAYSNTQVISEHDYNNYHVCKKCIGLREGEIAGIYGFNISLGGNIAVNYYTVLDECVLEDENAKMVFTVPDASYTVEVPVSEATPYGQFYIFTCEVAAKEMASDIYCQVVIEDDTSDTFRYSVKEYAEVILADSATYEKDIPLVKAMLNYGANSQVYFDYHTEKLANDSVYISDADKVLPQADLTEYQHTLEGEQEGVSYYGSSLVLMSETSVKHYFYFENEEDVETLEITVDGEKVTPVKNGGYYEIKISDIPAHRLQKMHEIKVGGITLKYGAFSYGLIAMNGTKENLKNTVRALYAYNREALVYNGE